MLSIKAAPIKTASHTIKRGESLYTIAKKNHTTVAALCKLNDISREKTLKVGTSIKVPVKKGSGKRDRKRGYVSKHSKKSRKPAVKSKERKLARALVKLNSKKIAEVNIKEVKKFTLGDIVFGRGGFGGIFSKKSKKIIELAKKNLGKRYVWGANGQKNAFDCSGFTSYVCKANGINIPRRAIEQSRYGKHVNRDELQPGDLIFFDTSKNHKGYVNHVGIYIGNGKFIHASSAKKKVIVTSLNKPFYSKRYKGARRVASL